MSSSKTEKPTPKKLKDAAQKGQSFKSKDFVIACLILIGLEYVINITSFAEMGNIIVSVINSGFKDNLSEYSLMIFLQGIKILMPFLVLCMAGSMFPTLLQTGFVIATKAMKINFDAINPAKGMKKFFSLRVLKDAIKSILYLSCFFISGVIFWGVNKKVIMSQVYASPRGLIVVWGGLFHSLITLCLACIIFVIVLDALAEFLLYIKDNKMDKQEVKREYKEQEGNPEVKSQRKQLHHELLSEQMKSDIKGSKAIITNPTHIAVGLYLNPDVLPLPFISVLETNHRALAVKKYAKEVGVPIVENIKLARLIHKTHKRYSFVNLEAIEEVLKLLQWLEQVENAWRGESLDSPFSEQ